MTTLVDPPASPEADKQPPAPKPASALRPPLSRRGLIIQIIFLALAAGSIYALIRFEVTPWTLWSEREDLINLYNRMVPPFLDNPGSVWSKALDTFLMAFAGTTIGVVLAIPVAMLSATNWTSSVFPRGVARALIVVTRALPELILALIFVRVYGAGVLPGILAIGIHSVGMLGKLFAEAIEQIDPGPREGAQATGAGRAQEFMTGIFPQVLPSFIAIALYRLDINFRAATLLGLVGAGGIGLDIRAHQGSLDYQQLLGVTLVIIVLILAVEMVSTTVRGIILGHNRSKGNGFDKWLRRNTPSAEDFRPDRDSVAAEEPSALANGSSSAAGAVAQSADRNRSIRPPWSKERITMHVFSAVCLALFVLAFTVPEITYSSLLTQTGELPGIFARLFPYPFDWWEWQYAELLLETVLMGLGATGIALLFAIPTALLASRNIAPARWVYSIARLFVLLVRALPDLIVAVFLVAALSLGPKPGVLALAVGLYGFGTKLFADAFEELSEAPRDGVRATGASGIQEVFTSVLPQATPMLVANSLYLLDGSIRSSTVLGIVGAGGIGFPLFQASRLFKFDMVGGLLILIFVIVYLIEQISVWIRKQII
jgi:phosphonate transport system permease protein